MTPIRSFLQTLLSRLFIKPLSKTLRQFLFSRILFIAFLAFAGVLVTTTLLYENLLANQARKTARGIAAQTFTAIDNLMEGGPSREEVWNFIADLKNSHSGSPYQMEVYRSTLVDDLFGQTDQPAPGQDILAVLASGSNLIDENGVSNRYLYPLPADNRCLSCHTNAVPGSVLGVLEVKQNIAALSSQMRVQNAGLFALLAAAILVLVLSVTAFVIKKVTSTIDLFRKKTATVQSLADLSTAAVPAENFSFAELNDSFAAVRELGSRLRDIAVDKDILEFEIKLLSKFIITSNVIQDWRGFIKELLLDINSLTDTYALLALFHDTEEVYELDIFWRSNPSSQNKALLEEIIRQQAFSHFHFEQDQATIEIRHHNACSGIPIPPLLTPRDIELHTKALLLDSPKVGGIVGIGVQSYIANDPVYKIVLDSILAALMNLVGSVKAISKYTKALEYYATRDPLTDLHNQRMFWELLSYETSRAERHGYGFGLLVIDLDNFKTVNDQHGHAYGDSFLNQFAEVLKRAVRDGDFVARYGGDEFTVILPETSTEQAYSVANRIAEELSSTTISAPDGMGIKVTISIGLAIYPDHGQSTRDLFMVADNMMYRVKNEGKNAIAYPESDDIAELFKNENEINFIVFQALEQQSLLPYFQPILRIDSDTICAHELLMRIRLPDGTVLPASEFIRAAGTMGLLYKLDCVLIEQAMAAIVEQNYQGNLFLNISPKVFIAPEFIGKVQLLINQYGIAPERIVFEVTERDTVGNIAMLQKFALKMKEEGFKFAIDDFGSGYSSFKYLKLFPIDYIKIEGDFIVSLRDDPDYMAFVKSIVTLAKELGIQTVAEFVEDEELFEMVGRLGIDYAQGYHVGRPGPLFLPVDERKVLTG